MASHPKNNSNFLNYCWIELWRWLAIFWWWCTRTLLQSSLLFVDCHWHLGWKAVPSVIRIVFLCLAVSLGTSRSFLLVDESDERTPLLLCFALLWEVGNFGGKEEIENLVYRKVNWYGIFLTLKHDIHKMVSAIFMVCSNLLMKLINAIIYGNLFMKLIKWYNYILIKVLYLL